MLDKIEKTKNGGVRIDALARNTDLAADGRIRRDYAVLSRALLAGASGQLRNKATTASNLLQRMPFGAKTTPTPDAGLRLLIRASHETLQVMELQGSM